MKKLWNAIDEKLIADSQLIALTEYDASDNITIARAELPDRDKSRGIYFAETLDEPLRGADTNKIHSTELDFVIVGTDQLICADILRRFEELFEDNDISKAFLDFSNVDVYCMFSKITDTERITKNEDLDVWETTVSVEITWSYK